MLGGAVRRNREAVQVYQGVRITRGSDESLSVHRCSKNFACRLVTELSSGTVFTGRPYNYVELNRWTHRSVTVSRPNHQYSVVTISRVVHHRKGGFFIMMTITVRFKI